MYCTSTQVKLLRDGDFISFEQNGIPKFPRPYIDFMKTYGIGTYGGAICITAPDFDILKSFAEYHFWKFKDAPITEEQFCECVAIGNSIDGDYIAIHSQVKGYILFPRNSGIIKLFPYDEERFIYSINKIGKYLYDEDLENYFEPVGAQSLFLHASSEITNALIERFKTVFKGDCLIENEYICDVFLRCMGGYVQFNLALKSEIAVFYSDYGLACFEKVKKFLIDNGCK